MPHPTPRPTLGPTSNPTPSPTNAPAPQPTPGPSLHPMPSPTYALTARARARATAQRAHIGRASGTAARCSRTRTAAIALGAAARPGLPRPSQRSQRRARARATAQRRDGRGGYSCATLENSYGCDCAGCGCQTAHPTPEPTVACKQTSQAVPTDMVFIVDGSGSVGASGFQDSKDFVNDVVAQFNIGWGSTDTRVGVVQYSSSGSPSPSHAGCGPSVSTPPPPACTSKMAARIPGRPSRTPGRCDSAARPRKLRLLTDGQSADTPDYSRRSARGRHHGLAVGVSSGSDSDYPSSRASGQLANVLTSSANCRQSGNDRRGRVRFGRRDFVSKFLLWDGAHTGDGRRLQLLARGRTRTAAASARVPLSDATASVPSSEGGGVPRCDVTTPYPENPRGPENRPRHRLCSRIHRLLSSVSTHH